MNAFTEIGSSRAEDCNSSDVQQSGTSLEMVCLEYTDTSSRAEDSSDSVVQPYSMELEQACRKGKRKRVRALVKNGASLLQQGGTRNATPLAYACKYAKLVRWILSSEEGHSTLEVITKDGDTPLILAAWHGRAKVVDLLLKSGADLCARDRCDWTALHCACAERGNVETVRVILDREVGRNALEQENRGGCTALHIAASCGHTEVVRLLIAESANVCAQNWSAETALHIACREKGNKELVKAILDTGENQMLDWTNSEGMRALHFAIDCGDADVIRLLLENGADVRTRGRKMDTVLHWACKSERYLDVLDTLLSSPEGQSILEWGDDDDRRPLQIAAQEDNTSAVHRLLEHGADVYAKDSRKLTALSVASEGSIYLLKGAVWLRATTRLHFHDSVPL